MRLDGSRAFGLVGQPRFCEWPGRIQAFVSLLADIKLCMGRLFDDDWGMIELLIVWMLSLMGNVSFGCAERFGLAGLAAS